MSLAVLSLRQIIDNTLRNVYPIIYGELVIHHVKQVVYLSKDPDTHRLCYEYFCLAWVDSAPCRLFCGDVDFFPVTLTILQREYQRETDGADYVLQNWILLLLEMVSDHRDQRHPHAEEVQSFLAKNLGMIGAGLGETATVHRIMKIILLLSEDSDHLATMATAPIKLLNSSLIAQLAVNLQLFLDHHIARQKKERKIVKIIEMVTILLYRCCQVDELREIVAEELLTRDVVRMANPWALLPTVVISEFEKDDRLREYSMGILKQIALIPQVTRVLMDPRHVHFTQTHLREVFELVAGLPVVQLFLGTSRRRRNDLTISLIINASLSAMQQK